ncbi:MAG: glycosyltransferase, partial [Ruminococcus sp.]|nr:glycosyltransferase [Ruminococcus sp.]
GSGKNVSSFKIKVRKFINDRCKRLLSESDFIRLASSRAAADWMYTLKYDFTVINNGIEIPRFIFRRETRDDVRSALGMENKFVIGHVGRFVYPKNHSFLLDIFKEIYSRNKNAVLFLVGSGSFERDIRKKADDLGIENAVVFYGAASNADQLYQAMDCFVFPSHFEGLGIAAVEAQAAGLKTLCSDTVPAEAQITDLLEYMSLSDTAEKWAEKILSYNNGYKREDMSEQIKNAGYDINQSAKQVEELYFG